MKVTVNPEVLEVTIDPLKGFKGIKDSKLFEATGLIPYFVAEAALTEGADTAQEVMNIMNEAYGFGMGDYNLLSDGVGQIDDDGLYHYEGDPDMSPMVEFSFKENKVWVYQFSLVAVQDADGNQVMQRMD